MCIYIYIYDPGLSCDHRYHTLYFCTSKLNIYSIILQGGGWCNTIRSCVYRKTTRRGSSNNFEKQLAFTGILSNKPEENPGTLSNQHLCRGVRRDGKMGRLCNGQ